jgi:methionine synthase I (cobalamin-dependent)
LPFLFKNLQFFQYYGNREKLRIIGWQDRLEEMNMEALRIAREVADETGTLMAGNICNTCCYDPRDESTWERTKQCIEVSRVTSENDLKHYYVVMLRCVRSLLPGM